MPTEEKRDPGKMPADDARGVLARLAGIPDAKLDDIGTETVQLREGEDRSVMIDAVRREMLRIMSSNLSETEKTFLRLKDEYEGLPEEDRTFNGELISWDRISRTIPNYEDFISGVNTLTDPQIYFINEKGALVIGDGCEEVPKETLGLDYIQSRSKAMRISYLDCDCKVVTVNKEDEVPLDAKIISERGLITYEEAFRKNHGQFECNCSAWVETGKKPESVRSVFSVSPYSKGTLGYDINIPQSKRRNRGSRCVFRVNLAL